MNRHFFRVVAAAAVAIALSSQVVRAQTNNGWNWLFSNQDPRLTATGIVVGGATFGAEYALYRNAHHHSIPFLPAYAIATVGCAAAFPIFGTLWLNRPLTTREVWTGMADCVVPIIGGWILEAAFHGKPWWDGAPPVVVVRHHHYRHK